MQNKVKIIRHEHNRGVAAARNTLLDNATGDYILWVDADDFIRNDAVSLLVDKAAETNADIINFGVNTYLGSGRSVVFEQKWVGNTNDFILGILEGRIHCSMWGRLFKHSLFTENGIKFKSGLNVSEDLYTIVQIAYYGRTFTNEKSLLYFYNAGNSTSITRTYSAAKAETELRVVDLLDSFLQGKIEVGSLIVEKRLAMWLYLVYDACLHGEREKFYRLKAEIRLAGCRRTRFRNKLYHFFISNDSYFICRIWALLMLTAKKYKTLKRRWKH